ncbi:MAG: FAD-dependent oxidoreductase [Pseudomonadota bacterium]
MNQQFKHLFTPLRVNRVEIPNRIMNTAHTTLFAESNNVMSDRYIDYLRERAKGGVGLIITQMQAVHPSSHNFERVDFGFDPKVVPIYKKLAKTVHQHGTKIFMQIFHSGRQRDSSFTKLPVLAPSPTPCPLLRETPKEMTKEDIREIVDAFGLVAEHAKKGGMDGVELHAAHGYLIQQFLSPLSNVRRDEYGGSPENRIRFLDEVAECVRKRVGDKFVVGVRLSADEFVEGGITLEDTRFYAEHIAEEGLLDYISITAATYATRPMIVPNMHVPFGVYLPFSSAIKEIVDIPVFVVARINDPLMAEQALADGHADMIGMTRACISDPEMPKKAKGGQLDEIRICIGCNQGCIGRTQFNKPMSCVQNPAVGFEDKLGIGTLKPTKRKKNVLIIGCGPAGLKTAEIAAQRGHKVTIWEKEEKAGGQVRMAMLPPGRDEFGGCVEYLVKSIKRLRVDMVFGKQATLQNIREARPDVVVVATGSVPRIPENLPGGNLDHVLTVWDVYDGQKPIGERVLMVDEEAHQKSLCTAEYLLDRGHHVEIVTSLIYVGVGMDFTNLTPLYGRLFSAGASMTTHVRILKIEEHRVMGVHIHSKKEVVFDGIDTVVLALGQRTNNALFQSLETEKDFEVYGVGDCVAPRTVLEAIHEGERVGRLI